MTEAFYLKRLVKFHSLYLELSQYFIYLLLILILVSPPPLLLLLLFFFTDAEAHTCPTAWLESDQLIGKTPNCASKPQIIPQHGSPPLFS